MFRRETPNEFNVWGQTVVITGGSDGMGKAVALELSSKGAHVVVVARTVSKLQTTVDEMKAKAANIYKQRFHYISADLTDPAECERVIAETTTWNSGAAPDIVWCCAGFSRPGYFIDVPIQDHREQMDTIYWTAANTAHATLRNWLEPVAPKSQMKTSRRHLIFTCSTLAFVPIAGYSPYSPAKAAIRSLSDTLSQEIEMYNGAYTQRGSSDAPAADVKIHTIFPMGILSPGYDNEQKMKPELTKKLEEADKPQTPAEVAQISVRALERGEYLVTTNFIGAIMKGTALGPSPRNGVVGDTMLSWLSNLVFLGVIPDLRGKTFAWGKKNGMPKPAKPASVPASS
ncbi:Short-chain dehydrogenase/reductase SDR [Penicillium griseofulvum]|uniref:3-dehydrosphinganine reductase n=1 Tax=Penicillium patulum TaxID=5078 RepID=A0A135LD60_PENPA|nr:Short-chain dehydrogenase/reductase SDR [Penicillium griseofulvum]KXG46892.1 Short-chain dehydrogenase/reductase SDR [Penicillium griseofulvum]